MNTYFLRMEGVNLYPLIYDTRDLSTIRGSGLMVLHAPEIIQDRFSKTDRALKKVMSGASIGLFSFEAETDQKAEEFRTEVATTLSNHEHLRHATFVVDVQKEEDRFTESEQKILAKNRWRQFQQPTVVIPEKNDDKGIRACQLDNLRPGAALGRKIKGEEKNVSISVDRRRQYGLNNKRWRFYEKETSRSGGCKIESDFVSDFDQLTSDASQGNLHHKMAVIYLDGNGFGKIRNELCTDAAQLSTFDKAVKDYRSSALKSLIEKMNAEDGYRSRTETGSGRYRMETLLWGGDELIWVVPGWKGWEVLGHFYQVSKEWDFGRQRLTHAGGLVFCHHNAPIHRIVSLCNDLAEAAKSEMRKNNSSENLFQYVVLESFDHIGRDLEAFRAHQSPFKWDTSLHGEDMAAIARLIRQLKADFPRTQIYKAIRSAIVSVKQKKKGIIDAEQDPYEQFKTRLKAILPEDALTAVDELSREKHFGHRLSAWLHIAQLWDYIPEETAAS